MTELKPEEAPPKVVSLERQLARHQGELVGTKIRLLDGEMWTFSANLCRGELSERLTAAIAGYFNQAEAEETAKGPEAAASDHAFTMCYLSLKINYPGLAEEALALILAKDMIPEIAYIANGMAQFRDLVQTAQVKAMQRHAAGAGIGAEDAALDPGLAADLAEAAAPDPS